MIIFDIDGTITGYNGVDDSKILNPKIKEIIQLLKKDNHIVCFSSGRSYQAALSFYKEAQLNTYLTCYNGAYTVNPVKKNSIPLVTPIANKVVKQILNEKIIQKNLLNLTLNKDDLSVFTVYDDEHFKRVILNNVLDYSKKNNFLEIINSLGEDDALQIVLEFNNQINLINKIISILLKYRDSVAFYFEKKTTKW